MYVCICVYIYIYIYIYIYSNNVYKISGYLDLAKVFSFSDKRAGFSETTELSLNSCMRFSIV